MEKVAILAITKNGIKIAKELKEKFSSWEVFAPNKFSDDNTSINWYGYNNSNNYNADRYSFFAKHLLIFP